MKGTIKENREFRYAYRRGSKCVSSYIVLHYVKNRGGKKIGINASKLSRAVDRNRAKRLIRVCWQKYMPLIPDGYNIIIVARSKMEFATLDDVDKAMRFCLKRSELI